MIVRLVHSVNPGNGGELKGRECVDACRQLARVRQFPFSFPSAEAKVEMRIVRRRIQATRRSRLQPPQSSTRPAGTVWHRLASCRDSHKED